MAKPDKKDQIVLAAEELFAAGGFDSTSIRDICKEAQVNVAMVNYYFGSKEGLLKEMIERKSAMMRGKLEALIQDRNLTEREKLQRAVENMVERMFTHRSFALSVIREMTKVNQPDIRRLILGLFMPNFQLLRELIKTGIRKKVFRKVDIEFTVSSFTGTVWFMISTGDLIIPALEGQTEKEQDIQVYKERICKHLFQLIDNHLVIA